VIAGGGVKGGGGRGAGRAEYLIDGIQSECAWKILSVMMLTTRA